MNPPSAFFNSTVQPPRPNPEINWAQLAQRWVAENATNDLSSSLLESAPNHYNSNSSGLPPQTRQQHYGNFFMPPPNIVSRPLIPLQQINFMTRPPPSLYPPAPPPSQYPIYDNPRASTWSNNINTAPPQRPLFHSHANEAVKPIPLNSLSPVSNPSVCTGAMAHWINDVTVDDPATVDWMNKEDWTAYDPNAIIDQQTRKKLPAWLLEGLEKAEKEKQKKLDQELLDEKRLKKEEERERRRKEKGLGKFDTDSEDEEEDHKRPSTSKSSKARSVFASQSHQSGSSRKRTSREVDEREYKNNEMMAIKRLVTDVLLEASEKALLEQVQRFSIRRKSEAKPKLIAKSSALAALSSIVGYSDDEESDKAD